MNNEKKKKKTVAQNTMFNSQHEKENRKANITTVWINAEWGFQLRTMN